MHPRVETIDVEGQMQNMGRFYQVNKYLLNKKAIIIRATLYWCFYKFSLIPAKKKRNYQNKEKSTTDSTLDSILKSITRVLSIPTMLSRHHT